MGWLLSKLQTNLHIPAILSGHLLLVTWLFFNNFKQYNLCFTQEKCKESIKGSKQYFKGIKLPSSAKFVSSLHSIFENR